MKVQIELVDACAHAANIEPEKIQKLIDKLKNQVKKEEVKDKSPKKEYAVVISDPEGKFDDIEDCAAWVMQITEDDNPRTILDKISKGAADYNTSKAGRRYPVKSVGEACEMVSARYFKEHQLWVKTKMPVQILTTNNKLQNPEQD